MRHTHSSRCANRATMIVCLLLAGLLMAPAQAQNTSAETAASQTAVYVTTQDFLSFRTGPGLAFERVAIIDPGVTLPAIGRSADVDWVQVYYNGQAGWVAALYLIWTGDIVQLPVDGIDTAPLIRRVGVAAVTTRDTPLYERDFTEADYLGTLPAGTAVELTGRLGGSGFFRVQVLHEGQLYWIGRWNVRVLDGSTSSLLNTSYLYAYGRIVDQLDNDIRQSQARLRRAETIWTDLSQGESLACENFPAFASTSRISDRDLQREQIFAPSVTAHNNAVERINRAIASFEDACGRTDPFITEQDVQDVLAVIDSARRALNIANSLYNALEDRDPILMPFTDF